jgi:hypothetical protein
VGRPDNWTLNAYLASGTLQNRVTTIGADNYSSASRAINGGIAEILMYDNALTSPEVNSVGAYLTGKYSLSTLYGADQSWAGGDSGTATIGQDGGFTVVLSPGTYAVSVLAKDGVDTMDEQGTPVLAKNLVAEKFGSTETSGLEVTVDADGKPLVVAVD